MNNQNKNSYVKTQIFNATISLLEEKDLSHFSIVDIITKAEVSRNSFYRNYSDKTDILRQHIQSIIGEWTNDYDNSGKNTDADFMGSMFAHIKKNSDFYTLLSKRNLLYLFLEVLKDISGPKAEYPNIGAYTAAFFTYGIYGWTEEWIKRGMQESGDEMAMLMQKAGK